MLWNVPEAHKRTQLSIRPSIHCQLLTFIIVLLKPAKFSSLEHSGGIFDLAKVHITLLGNLKLNFKNVHTLF